MTKRVRFHLESDYPDPDYTDDESTGHDDEISYDEVHPGQIIQAESSGSTEISGLLPFLFLLALTLLFYLAQFKAEARNAELQNRIIDVLIEMASVMKDFLEICN